MINHMSTICSTITARAQVPGDPKKYSRLTKHQTILFCFITTMFLDSESIFIDLDFDTLTSQIR